MTASVVAFGFAILALLGTSQGIPQYQKEPSCPQICPANYAPVCGSNGQTYSNECQLNVAACNDDSITKVSDGDCGGAPRRRDCPQICPANYAPVCGSNGQTYSNDCNLGVAACDDPSITKASDGECAVDCPQFCTANYDPVCGSNGQTYGNDCELGVASCGDPSITKEYDGECREEPSCPQICPANYAPVCGSNGQTYSNKCQLNVAACEDDSITKVSDGGCGIATRW